MSRKPGAIHHFVGGRYNTDLSSDGTLWLVTDQEWAGWRNFDSSFNQLSGVAGQTTVAPYGSYRGLAYDSTMNHVYAGQNDNIVFQTDLAGNLLNKDGGTYSFAGEALTV